LQKENKLRVIEVKEHIAESTEVTETIQTEQTLEIHHGTTKTSRSKPGC